MAIFGTLTRERTTPVKLDFSTSRRDFPALAVKARGKPVVYFDNACMSLKPRQVVEAMERYYYEFPGCHGRVDHLFGRRTTEAFSEARRKFQRFVNARFAEQIVFTRNATEGINWAAQFLPLREGDTVLTSALEHNSNFLPWQRLARTKGIRHEFFELSEEGCWDEDAFRSALDRVEKLRLVSVVYTSNVTGVTLPIEEIVALAHERGAMVLVDAAQAAAHRAIDVQRLDADLLVLSAHKFFGPTGVGALYARRELLEKMTPPLTGGETVEDVTYVGHTLSGIPDRYEAGLQDYAGIIGAGAAIDYLSELDREAARDHEVQLNRSASEAVREMPGTRILGPEAAEERGSILNFVVEGIDPLEVANLLDETAGIMVRGGKHCCHAWYNQNGLRGSVRASFAFYNTADEVDRLVSTLRKVLKYFR